MPRLISSHHLRLPGSVVRCTLARMRANVFHHPFAWIDWSFSNRMNTAWHCLFDQLRRFTSSSLAFSRFSFSVSSSSGLNPNWLSNDRLVPAREFSRSNVLRLKWANKRRLFLMGFHTRTQLPFIDWWFVNKFPFFSITTLVQNRGQKGIHWWMEIVIAR